MLWVVWVAGVLKLTIMEEKKSGLKEVEVNGWNVIGINLKTVEDVDVIIRRCEAIKQNIIDGRNFGEHYTTEKVPSRIDYMPSGQQVVLSGYEERVLPLCSDVVVFLGQ